MPASEFVYKRGVTSLYLAKREGNDLVYVGKAGTGFTQSIILELNRLMKPITLPQMPLNKIKECPSRLIRAWHQIASLQHR